jgi:hypothetical protein
LLRFYSLRPPPRGNPTKSLLSDQENCCRALPLFTMRCGPPSFWFGLPAILPSPPFLSLLSLVRSSLCLQTQGCVFLNFGGPKTGGPRRFDLATSHQNHPPGKKRPPQPGQGQRWHRGPPRLPQHLVAAPPSRCQVPTTAREARKQPSPAPGLGAPTRSRSLTKLRRPHFSCAGAV